MSAESDTVWQHLYTHVCPDVSSGCPGVLVAELLSDCRVSLPDDESQVVVLR